MRMEQGRPRQVNIANVFCLMCVSVLRRPPFLFSLGGLDRRCVGVPQNRWFRSGSCLPMMSVFRVSCACFTSMATVRGIHFLWLHSEKHMFGKLCVRPAASGGRVSLTSDAHPTPIRRPSDAHPTPAFYTASVIIT